MSLNKESRDDKVNDIFGKLHLPERYLKDQGLIEVIRALVSLAYTKGEIDGFDRENFK